MVVRRSRCHTEIWEALDISHQTFYRWLEQGRLDAEAGKGSLERQFHEIVAWQKRLLAQRLVGRAVEAAEGVVVQEETKDGPRVYTRPPDGRLAASIARSLDPEAMPPEKQEIQHEGTLNIALMARERLRKLFGED